MVEFLLLSNLLKKPSDDDLKKLTQNRFETFLAKGVTTVEAKSGYGLIPEEELRALRILKDLNSSMDMEIISTCLALHALPVEYDSYKKFVSDTNKNLLPLVAKEKLARYVDVFIETGYFSVEDAQPYVELAKELGFGIRIHADEFSDAGAAKAAGSWGAASADHLQAASKEGIQSMAENGVVATILPGTSLYTNIPFTKAEPFFEAGCVVGLATDYNPGSCLVDSLPLIATMGALHCGLTTAQAVAAVTYVPALSLGLQNSKGALAKGFDADFFLFPGSEASEWLADMGRTIPTSVWVKGNKAL